jgi:hypothetical protein
VSLAGFRYRNVGEDHDCGLDGVRLASADLVHVKITALFCVFYFDNLSVCRPNRPGGRLDVVHQELKNTSRHIKGNQSFDPRLIERKVDKALECL